MDVNLLFSLWCALGALVAGANQAHHEGTTTGMPMDPQVHMCRRYNRPLFVGPSARLQCLGLLVAYHLGCENYNKFILPWLVVAPHVVTISLCNHHFSFRWQFRHFLFHRSVHGHIGRLSVHHDLQLLQDVIVQSVVPIVSLTHLHCFVVVVEVYLCIFRRFIFVRKQEPGIMIDGPMANCYRRSSRTCNMVEAFSLINK